MSFSNIFSKNEKKDSADTNLKFDGGSKSFVTSKEDDIMLNILVDDHRKKRTGFEFPNPFDYVTYKDLKKNIYDNIIEPFFAAGRVQGTQSDVRGNEYDGNRTIRQLQSDPSIATSLWSLPPDNHLPLPEESLGSRTLVDANKLARESCAEYAKQLADCERDSGFSVATATTASCRKERVMGLYCEDLFIYFLDLYGYTQAATAYERTKIAYYADIKVRNLDTKMKNRSYTYVAHKRHQILDAYENNVVLDEY